MDLSDIHGMMARGMTLEDVAENMSWQAFEELCLSILEENGFSAEKHYRFMMAGQRHEIDILASKLLVKKHGTGSRKSESFLAVDCKHWAVGRTSALKVAAEKQAERSHHLKAVKGFGGKPVTPVIVTLFQENVTKNKDAWIVPVFKLNSFLGEFVI